MKSEIEAGVKAAISDYFLTLDEETELKSIAMVSDLNSDKRNSDECLRDHLYESLSAHLNNESVINDIITDLINDFKISK